MPLGLPPTLYQLPAMMQRVTQMGNSSTQMAANAATAGVAQAVAGQRIQSNLPPRQTNVSQMVGRGVQQGAATATGGVGRIASAPYHFAMEQGPQMYQGYMGAQYGSTMPQNRAVNDPVQATRVGAGPEVFMTNQDRVRRFYNQNIAAGQEQLGQAQTWWERQVAAGQQQLQDATLWNNRAAQDMQNLAVQTMSQVPGVYNGAATELPGDNVAPVINEALRWLSAKGQEVAADAPRWLNQANSDIEGFMTGDNAMSFGLSPDMAPGTPQAEEEAMRAQAAARQTGTGGGTPAPSQAGSDGSLSSRERYGGTTAEPTGGTQAAGGAGGAGAAGGQAQQPSTPSFLRQGEGKWWDDFSGQHGGENMVDYYMRVDKNVGSPEEAMVRSRLDKKWSMDHAKQYGREPTRGEWEGHYAKSRGRL